MLESALSLRDPLAARSVVASVAEPHHFYAAPGENFDAAPAPALL
jgi:hypothetical protein